jgi:hypothetical protein
MHDLAINPRKVRKKGKAVRINLRWCPQAQFFSPKNTKTYLSCQKKGTFGGLPGVALSRGRDIPGHSRKNTVSNTVSFPPLNYSPSMLAVLLVVALVVVLLSCCCCCLCLLCCRVANTAAATTIGTPPTPPLPLVDKEDDACYTNTNSIPSTLTQAVCQALESHASWDRPLPAGYMGGKGGNDDGGTNGGSRSRITHRIGMVLPSPTQGGVAATRVAGK